MDEHLTVAIITADGKLRSFEDIEREVIYKAIFLLKNASAVSRQLRIGRSTLYRKLDHYKEQGYASWKVQAVSADQG